MTALHVSVWTDIRRCTLFAPVNTDKWFIYVTFARWTSFEAAFYSLDEAIQHAKAVADEFGGRYVGISDREVGY